MIDSGNSPALPATAGMAPDTDSRQRHVGWRFSLADIFAATLGIAVALGVWRLTGVAWHYGLLCAFAVWFAMGAWSQASAVGRALPGQLALDPLAGQALRLKRLTRWMAPIAVAIAVMSLIAHEAGWVGLRTTDIDYGVVDGLAVALLLLPILALCNSPRAETDLRRGFWLHVKHSMGLISSFVLAVVIAFDILLITVLVHAAIEGVLSAIPLRRRDVMTGTPPVNAATRQLFSTAAMAATVVWWTTLALARRTSRIRPSEKSWRWHVLGLTVAGLLLAALTLWGVFIFCRRISPLLGESIGAAPPAVLWLACVVVAYVVMWATPLLIAHDDGTRIVAIQLDSAPRRYVHEWWAVICLPAIWFLVRLGDLYQQELWRFITGKDTLTWDDLGYYLQDRVNWFGTAYLFALFVIAWRRWRWRGRDEPGVIVVVPRPRMTIAVAALGTLVLVVTAPPILMWLGFVLWTWPQMLPGEAWLTSGS
jgi:arginine exporter protein ArgO